MPLRKKKGFYSSDKEPSWHVEEHNWTANDDGIINDETPLEFHYTLF